MAKDKTSFILYTDIAPTVNKLPDEIAGKLFKLILSYVNDEKPEVEDLLLQIAFEPIKQQLKRNLVSWNESKEEKSIAGINSAFNKYRQRILNSVKPIAYDLELISLTRKLNELGGFDPYIEKCILFINQNISTPVDSVKQQPTKPTVNVNVNVNANVPVNVIKEDIDVRKLKFSNSLKEFNLKLPIENKIPEKIITDFYSYWTEPNKSKTKFRQELQKTWDLSRRLKTWVENDFGFKNKNGHENKLITKAETIT